MNFTPQAEAEAEQRPRGDRAGATTSRDLASGEPTYRNFEQVDATAP